MILTKTQENEINHLYYFPTETQTDIKYIYVQKLIFRKLNIFHMKIGFDKAFKLVPTLPGSVDRINKSTKQFNYCWMILSIFYQAS